MDVVVETLSPLERRVKVTVPAEKINNEVEARIKRLARTAKIDGFRPGKVPPPVIRQRFGQSLQIEVLDELINNSLQQALQQENLRPAGTPEVQLNDYQPGEPLGYTATFEIFPVIEVQPFNHIVVEKLVAEVASGDVEKTLEGMRKQQTHWHEVDRPAKEHDRVWIVLNGTIEGQPFEGGKADNMSVILGSHNTIAGFEEGLLNALTNQQLTLNLQFPENYGAKALAGKPVVFDIKINKIEEPHIPALDEEFAKRFGIETSEGESGVEKLREEVKQTLAQQLTFQLRRFLKAEVMGKLAEAYKEISVPQALVREEAKELMQQMQKQFESFKTQTPPNFTVEMFMDRAKERVVLGLVINAIIKRDQLKAEPNKVRELIEDVAQRFDNPEQIVKWYYQQKDRLHEMEILALEDQIVDKIVAEATIVEKQVLAADVLNREGV